MGDSKNTASTQKGGVKITELGKELNVDPREIVAAAKDMAMENAKVPASWVTFGQAERLRAKFGGNKELKARLERVQRAKEESAQPAAAEPAPVRVHHVKLGKKTFETDRRGIFGVIETPGGVRMDRTPHPHTTSHESHKPKAEAPAHGPRPAQEPAAYEPRPQGSGNPPHSAPAPTQASEPAAQEPRPQGSGSAALAVVNEPPKKFIGVQVAPPIRRAPEQADPRFGVVTPASKTENPETKDAPSAGRISSAPSGLWDKLDDGRAQPHFAKEKPDADAAELTKAIPQEEAAAPAPETVASAATPVSQAHAPAAAETGRLEAGAPTAPAATTEAHEETVDYTPPPPKAEDVPVKWQPSHKAYGAKHKLKNKKHKLLKSAAPAKHAEPKRKEKHEHKHAEPAHAHAPKHHAEHKPHATHGHGKSEGILKRLVRKFFKK